MTNATDYFDAFPQGSRLVFYTVYAKDAEGERRPLDCVAKTPEEVIDLWLDHYGDWPMNNIQNGPDVRTRTLPNGVGMVPWSVGDDISFDRRIRRWQGSAPCVYFRLKWVRA